MHLILTQFDCIEIQSLTEEKAMSFCNFLFTADKTVKNRALIVSVENFYPGAGLNKRNGAKKDTRRLHKILSKLGFSVDIRMDIEADEIYEAFKAGNVSPSYWWVWFWVNRFALKRLCQIWNLHIHPRYSLTPSSILREQDDGQRLFCGHHIQSRWGGCCVWCWRMCCETGRDLQLLWRSINGRQEQTLSDPGTFCEIFLTDKLLWPSLL